MRRPVALLLASLACAEPEPELLPPLDVPEAPGPCEGVACGEGCGAGLCNAFGECVAGAPPACPSVQSGRDLPPGTGMVFVVNAIAIAGQDRGYDLDGACNPTCIDNVSWQIGELGNDQIRQGLLGGESLLLVELARDPGSELGTLKLYRGRDADEPFFPANNFKVPPGHTTCCEFSVESSSLGGTPPQARARLSVRLREGRLRSVSTGVVPSGTFDLRTQEDEEGASPIPFAFFGRLERVIVQARIPANEKTLDEALLGGAVPMRALAEQENPYCRTVSPRCTQPYTDSSLLDLYLRTGLRPDIDLDGDGLEEVRDEDGDGRVDTCLDGCTGDCRSPERVPPLDPANPASCVLSPRMSDGYSITITFTAVRASIVGIR